MNSSNNLIEIGTPGGTGKTRSINLLLTHLRSTGIMVKASTFKFYVTSKCILRLEVKISVKMEQYFKNKFQ